MKRIIILLLLIIIFPLNIQAEKQINAHLFYQDGCPHCSAEKEFFAEYLKENKDIKLYTYNVKDKVNIEYYHQAQSLSKKKTTGVPFLIIGNQGVSGFGSKDSTGKTITSIIDYYRVNNYRDLLGEEIGLVEKNESIILEENINENIAVPILGNIDPKTVSLPILAIVVGFVDGFNPCAMWVLIFLITMLFGMKNRKKMWILGLTFLFISSLTYFLFMIAWLNIASLLSKIIYIRVFISVVALIFGIINITKFLKKDQADPGCDVVDDNKRTNIMDRIKKIIASKSFILSLIGIALLAVSVNVIELLCSLGLPVIFTQVLAINNLNITEQILYILLYILFFLIDDLIIFFLAMKSLKIKAISNRYTKYSHLIGGIIMLIIGLLMLIKPEWLMFNF